MSTCISSHGEFGSHILDDMHTCTRCYVLDEDALRAELAQLRAQFEALRAKEADVPAQALEAATRALAKEMCVAVDERHAPAARRILLAAVPHLIAEEVEWCVWYGGTDANDCASTITYDDEAAAEEMLQWIDGAHGKGIARRTVSRSPWRDAQ